MPKIAFIGGSDFDEKKLLKGFEQEIIKTMYGNVLLYKKGKVIFLPRHGKNNNIPSHRVNTKANICALNLLGTEKIIGLNSVGSLKETIKPGAIIIPDDYVNFSPDSFFELDSKQIEPTIDENLRKELVQSSKKLKITTKNKATYIQVKGHRLQTKSEIKIIKKWGDIVGMTLAFENTLSQELGIPYAAISGVRDFAKGIAKKVTPKKTIEKKKDLINEKFLKIIKELIKKNKR